MRHGSLFSGIGGFDLAAEWMGWENVFSCEINPFGRKILEYYWSNAKHYEDIKTTDFTIHRGGIDILTGGFPCQPFSQAGKRKGTEDDRHLWPEMLRAIKEIKPTWVVGENVYGIVNWNRGLVFDQVQTDLENEGYEIQPVILPAGSIEAPHKRERVWFIAYNNQRDREKIGFQTGREEYLESNGRNGNDSNSKSHGHRRGKNKQLPIRERKLFQGEQKRSKIRSEVEGCSRKPGRFENFPTQPPVCSGDDELSSRLDNITFPKWRNESIKGYGNAVVPQLVYEIFKVIQEYENQNT
jgi:DNA (cytosine-5)-methyltransferase 1